MAVLGPGQLLGVSGGQSCVGVVLTSGKAGQPTYALHFIAGKSNVPAGFMAIGLSTEVDIPTLPESWAGPTSTKVVSIPSGYKAVLCGAAQNDPPDIPLSNGTLQQVIKLLRSQGVPIIGYVPSSNVAVDTYGSVYWTLGAYAETKKGYYFEGD
jgi:hypothetical protein